MDGFSSCDSNGVSEFVQTLTIGNNLTILVGFEKVDASKDRILDRIRFGCLFWFGLATFVVGWETILLPPGSTVGSNPFRVGCLLAIIDSVVLTTVPAFSLALDGATTIVGVAIGTSRWRSCSESSRSSAFGSP